VFFQKLKLSIVSGLGLLGSAVEKKSYKPIVIHKETKISVKELASENV